MKAFATFATFHISPYTSIVIPPLARARVSFVTDHHYSPHTLDIFSFPPTYLCLHTQVVTEHSFYSPFHKVMVPCTRSC